MANIVLDLGEGFRGECSIAGSEGLIDAVAVFDSLEVPVPQQGGSRGKRTVGRTRQDDIEIVRRADFASPVLAWACSNARSIPTAIISLFRTVEGKTVQYMECKLWKCFISRLERDNEDTMGTVYGPHINTSGSVSQPRSSAGLAAVIASQQRRETLERPVSLPALPRSVTTITPVQIERLWIRPTAVEWSYKQYVQGTLQGTTSTGWDYEEGVDISQSSLLRARSWEGDAPRRS